MNSKSIKSIKSTFLNSLIKGDHDDLKQTGKVKNKEKSKTSSKKSYNENSNLISNSTLNKNIIFFNKCKLSSLPFLGGSLLKQQINKKPKTFNFEINKQEISDNHSLNKTINTPPSVYLEEHKGMNWRCKQLLYQIPEQDERLLTRSNSHLSNELKFVRTQQKLCSIPVKLYINNNGAKQQQTTSNLDNKQTNDIKLICIKCEQVISVSTYCVQVDLSNIHFYIPSKCIKTNSCKDQLSDKNNLTSGHLRPADFLNQAQDQKNVLNKQEKLVYFHIDCLQCISCNEILVDFRAYIYPLSIEGERPLKIYCFRHFLELFKPRCQLCEELIFDEKCTEAEGKVWHIAHFCCFQCKIPLGGQQYVMASLNNQTNRLNSLQKDKIKLEDLQNQIKQQIQVKEHPFCLNCFDQFFGEFCKKCNQLITCDQNRVKQEQSCWKNKSKCLHCETCGLPLPNHKLNSNHINNEIFFTNDQKVLKGEALINLNQSLMKLNDKLRSNQYSNFSCIQNSSINQNVCSSSSVEYENSSMFHLAAPKKQTCPNQCSNQEQLIKQDVTCSPDQNLSNTNFLCSSSFTSETNSNSTHSSSGNELNISNTNNSQSNSSSSKPSIVADSFKKLSTENLDIKNKLLNNQNQSNFSLDNISQKSYNSFSNQQKENVSQTPQEMLKKNKKPSIDPVKNFIKVNEDKLVHNLKINNTPFTRRSIIIDNLNTTLISMQILDNQLNKRNSTSSSITSGIQSENGQSNNNNVLPTIRTENISNKQHYSTLPVRKPQRILTQSNQTSSINSLSHESPDQFILNMPKTRKPIITTNEVYLEENHGNKYILQSNLQTSFLSYPNSHSNQQQHHQHQQQQQQQHQPQLTIPNNFINYMNCTLPRNVRSNNLQSQQVYNMQLTENSKLAGVQSFNTKNSNTLIHRTLNRNQIGGSCNNLIFQQSVNSVNKSKSVKPNTLNYKISSIDNNLQQHCVFVSQEQMQIPSHLVVKPLINYKKTPTRTPPLPPVDKSNPNFYKKRPIPITNNITLDLPIIQETSPHDDSDKSNSIDQQLEQLEQLEINQTKINIDNEDSNIEEYTTNLLNSIQYSSSNNSLNNQLNCQPNLNCSNSASLASATSSCSSETASQISRANLFLHNKPDVIQNPIETIHQLKQQQHLVKLKEKKLKKEKQVNQISNSESKPKIIEEKLKKDVDKNKEDNKKSVVDNKTLTESPKPKTNTNSYSSSLNSLDNSLYKNLPNKLEQTNTRLHQSQPNLLQTKIENHFDATDNNLDLCKKQEKIITENSNNDDDLCSSSSSHQSPTNIQDTDSLSSILNDKNSTVSNQFKKNQNLFQSQSKPLFKNSSYKSTNELQNCSTSKNYSKQNCDQIVKAKSAVNLKQKSVSFDPSVKENENNKAPRRIRNKSNLKYNKKNIRKDYHNYYYSHCRKQDQYKCEENACSTCSSSCSYTSSSYSSSSSEDEIDEKKYTYSKCRSQSSLIKNKPFNTKYNEQIKTIKEEKMVKFPQFSNLPPEQMVKIMHQQQLMIQKQLAQQMHSQELGKNRQRYLKNNTSESCIIF